MDDGIIAIILLVSGLSIALYVYIYLADDGLKTVLLMSLIFLTVLLVYTCLSVISTKWERYKRMKEWDFCTGIEKIKKF